MKKFLLRTVSVFLIMLFVISICTISVSSAIVYTNSSGTIKVVCGSYKKQFSAKQYNNNFSAALNAALDTAGKKAKASKPATVTVQKGYYTLDRTIKIYSNTKLKATGCYFRHYGNLLRNGYKNKATSATGYMGAKNITIIGGSWDAMVPYSEAGTANTRIMHSTMRFGHCKNIVIKNCAFVNNYNCHDIELGGVNTAKITKCSFSNPLPVNNFPNNGGREAIQIDSCTYEAMPEFVLYDYTRSKNITVCNSTFKNKFRGVGSHHAVLGKTYDNINVHHNTFENIGGIAIYAVYWTNSKIYNNTMTNVGLGVDMRSMTTGSGYNFYNYNHITFKKAEKAVKDKPIYIFSNNIHLRTADNTYTRACGIRIMGEIYESDDPKTGIPAGIYKVYNVNVGVNAKGNTKPNNITGNVAVGVQLNYGVDSVIRGNSMDLEGSVTESTNGIEIKSCENCVIDKNTVKNGLMSESKGIMLMPAGTTTLPSVNVTVSENDISGFTKSGVYSYLTEGTIISNNKISDSFEGGINLRESINPQVYNNSVSNIDNYGVYVYDNCEGVFFSENDISTVEYGAYIKSALNTTFTKNSFTACEEQGAMIRQCSDTIFEENVVGSVSYAVRVNYGSDKTFIKNNVLTSATADAIYCIGSSDATSDIEKSVVITDNTLSSASNCADVRVASANLAAHIWNNFNPDGTAASYRFKGEDDTKFTFIYEDIAVDNLSVETINSESGEAGYLEWTALEGVNGYRVYKTFGGKTELIADTAETSYADITPTVGSVTYTIIPYKNYTNIKYLGTPISVDYVTEPSVGEPSDETPDENTDDTEQSQPQTPGETVPDTETPEADASNESVGDTEQSESDASDETAPDTDSTGTESTDKAAEDSQVSETVAPGTEPNEDLEVI